MITADLRTSFCVFARDCNSVFVCISDFFFLGGAFCCFFFLFNA